MKLEVRCCCVPNNVLGWLEVPNDVRCGQQVFFVLHQPKLWHQGPNTIAPVKYSDTQIVLEVSAYQDIDGSMSRALKSNDYPIDVLKQIPGFIEA